MKFAKRLEEDLVQEWKAKYVNYKKLKKLLKKVAAEVELFKKSQSQRSSLDPPVSPSSIDSRRSSSDAQRASIDATFESPGGARSVLGSVHGQATQHQVTSQCYVTRICQSAIVLTSLCKFQVEFTGRVNTPNFNFNIKKSVLKLSLVKLTFQ